MARGKVAIRQIKDLARSVSNSGDRYLFDHDRDALLPRDVDGLERVQAAGLRGRMRARRESRASLPLMAPILGKPSRMSCVRYPRCAGGGGVLVPNCSMKCSISDTKAGASACNVARFLNTSSCRSAVA